MKLKKLALLGLTVTASVLLLAACGGSKSDSSSEKKSTRPITIWTTSNVEKENAEKWGKDNGKDVEAVVVPWDDFQTKLKQQVGDPKTTPDVFLVAKDFVKDWSEKEGVVVNLEKEFPDDVSDYKENAFNGIAQLGANADGKVVSVTNQYPIGVMFYNRKIAKEILGTDDPTAVAESMSTFEKWSDVNAKIQAKYGDKVKLLGNFGDTNNMLKQQRTVPYVVDDTFTIGKEIVEVFEQSKVLYDQKMFLAETENEAYQAGYNQDAFFANFIPSWGFASKIKPQIEGKESAGNWGAASPTYTYTRGGGFYFISEKSSNKKDAWDYIKSQTINEDTLIPLYKEALDFPSSQPAAEKIVASGYEEPLLGNQKIFDLYETQAKLQEVDFKDVVTKYDGTISALLAELGMNYGNGTQSKDEVLKSLADQVKTAYPDLKIKKDY
jgi:ABC-type glycerol-3-phosphate transport system substrate-binding protein